MTSERNRNYKGKYKPGKVTNPVYKEDSTRGKSLLINPQTFKGDVLVQVWVDSRILATLSNWLDTHGSYTRFMSEVVKDTLKASVEMLVKQGEVDFIDDTTDARNLLVAKYRVNLNPAGKGMKNVIHNQLLSNKNKGMEGKFVANKGPLGVVENKVEVPTDFRTSDEEYERMRMKIEEADRLERDAELKVAIDDMKERGVLAAESKSEQSSVVREGASQEELDEHVKVNDKEVLARENAPFDIEEVMRLQEERLAKNQVR